MLLEKRHLHEYALNLSLLIGVCRSCMQPSGGGLSTHFLQPLINAFLKVIFITTPCRAEQNKRETPFGTCTILPLCDYHKFHLSNRTIFLKAAQSPTENSIFNVGDSVTLPARKRFKVRCTSTRKINALSY